MPRRENWRRQKPPKRTGYEQPVWRMIANLGDADPFDWGGYFVYEAETGVYPEEAVVLLVVLLVDDEDREDSTYTVYRIMLKRLKMVRGYLVPLAFDHSWPHPVESYNQWFHDDLGEVARSTGTTKEVLEGALTSSNPLERAMAYKEVALYYGWDNFDASPDTGLTRAAVELRYSSDLESLRRRRR